MKQARKKMSGTARMARPRSFRRMPVARKGSLNGKRKDGRNRGGWGGVADSNMFSL
jgi:hypothetical protein